MQVTYIGPEAEVDVPELRRVIKPGDTVEVTTEQAAGLLCQPDNWQKATAAKTTKTESA